MECPLLKRQPQSDTEEDYQVCLNCPYPRCVYDYERKRREPKFFSKIRRNKTIVKMSDQGELAPDIAVRFGLTTRQVRRILNGK